LVPPDTPVDLPPWADFAVGSGHTCAVTRYGKAFCFGHNADGQLGNGNTLDIYLPQKVTDHY
jgi:alpha-tubulin suppressor-like RCC1 family protein